MKKKTETKKTPPAKNNGRETAARLIAADPARVKLGENNCRIIDEKSPEFLEFVAAVAAAGVLIPVHVRTHPDDPENYELLAGERRLRAARAAQLATIPAVDHGPIDDGAAFEITFVENYGRRDLSALEEVRAAAILLERHQGDVAAVAAHLGRTEKWVRLRVNIDGRLSAAWRKELARAESPYAGWGAAHLGLIARLPAAAQAGYLVEWKYQAPRLTADQLDRSINNDLRRLAAAGWPLDDATLVPTAGACSECPQRSGADPLLWLDDAAEAADPKAGKKKDSCLDGDCWRQKTAAHLLRRHKELAAEHQDLVLVEGENSDYAELAAAQKKFTGIVRNFDYSFAKAGERAAGARPALVVCGRGTGSVRWVKPMKVTSAAGAKKTALPGTPRTFAQRRAALDAKRWAQVLIELREKVENTPRNELNTQEKYLTVVLLAIEFGTITNRLYVEDDQEKEPWETIISIKQPREAAAQAALKDKLYDQLWQRVRPVLAARLNYNGPITQTPDALSAEAQLQAKLVGADVEAIFAAVAERKGFTEPKSWGPPAAEEAQKKIKKKNKRINHEAREEQEDIKE